MLSLVTNVCAIDTIRIRQMLPNWLRVFDSRLNEIVVVIDETPPSGRIAALHGNASSDIEALRAQLESWRKKDSRITLHTLNSQSVDDSCRRWFVKGKPLRCQAGTPISAFICAIDAATSPLILRSDCDVLFYDNGWVDAAAKLLESGRADIVEPPRLGVDPAKNNLEVSTRAFMLHRPSFENLLPITAHKLNLPRRMHRWLYGRPSWLALEQMLDVERKQARLRHVVLSNEFGFSLHVSTREQAALVGFERVVQSIERGEVPEMQIAAGPNFLPAAWGL